MPDFDAGFLRWLLLSSASATAIAGVVVVVQTLFGRWLTPAGRQRLWLLVVVRLLLPILPASAMSIANLHIENLLTTRQVDAPIASIANDAPGFVTTIRIKPVSIGAASSAEMPVASEIAPRRSWADMAPQIVTSLWAVVALAILVRLLWVNRALAIRLRRATPVTHVATLGLLETCMRSAGVRTPVRIVATDAVTAPAVHGLVRPQILMPAGLLESLTPAQQRHIILHELSHIRHHDVLANWLLALLSIVHWFNPLLWIAFGRLKADRELARDAWVIRHTGASDSAGDYAETLIDLAQRISGSRSLSWPRIATPMPALFGRKTSLRRRLHMIARQSSSHRGSQVTGFVLLLLIAGGFLTRARAQVADPKETPGATRSDVAPASRPAAAKPAQDNEVEKLTRDAQEAINAFKYADALEAVNKILKLDPKNTYAFGVQPLLQDRMLNAPQLSATAIRQLNRVLPSMQFDAVGFNDVVDFMRDISGANIFVNWKVLEAAGIDRNTPVTANVHSIKFSKALDLILDSVGGGQTKLGYTIEEGVFTISTKDDLQKNVVIRVYDIRDLLTNSATDAPGKGDKQPRQQRVDDLIKLIEESVDSESWKDRGGKVGSLRVFDPSGQLIVTQTPDNHRALVNLLDGVRARRGLQILLEVEYIDWDSAAAGEAMKKWWTRAAQRAPTTQEAAAGVVIPEPQYAMPTRDLKGAEWSYVSMASPKLMLLDGQEATVSTVERRSYVSDFAMIRQKDGSTRYEPVRASLEPGVDVEATATVTADRAMVKLSVHPKLTTLLAMKQEPWAGRPSDSNLSIESPQLAVTEARISAMVPDKYTLMVIVPRQEKGRSLVILIKPTVVPPKQTALEQREFPVLSNRKTVDAEKPGAPGMQRGYVDVSSRYPWMKD